MFLTISLPRSLAISDIGTPTIFTPLFTGV
jgi:hypothetical protein